MQTIVASVGLRIRSLLKIQLFMPLNIKLTQSLFQIDRAMYHGLRKEMTPPSGFASTPMPT